MEKFITCICHSTDHLIKMQIFEWGKDKDLEDVDLAVSVHMSPEPSFFKRIWIAIKYIFGHQSQFGEFSEILLDDKKTEEIIEFLEYYLEKKKILKEHHERSR